ncbi:MAG: tetratricopeptide repeat protein, partial [Pseudomonadota bacterium]
MRQIENADGIALTAADASHIAAYDALITAFVGFRRETGAMAKTLAEDAPEMPMALAAKGYLSKMAGSAEGTAAAGRAAKALGSLVDAGHANAHERTHAAALDRWLAGDMDGATRLWEGLTADTPGDTLALRLQHFMHFYTGEVRRIR